VSGFSAQWLQLREPLDVASRDEDLCAFLRADLASEKRQHSRLTLIDLGAGTGANLRYAAPRLGGPQDWLLVEQDPLLLQALERKLRDAAPSFDCHVRILQLDLARRLHQLPLADGVVLTASALLDLVSEAWLQALARAAATVAATVWFALNYDGRIECVPAEPEDAEIRDLFNLHQLQDKGFGPALGPGSGRMAEQLFAQLGYRIRSAPSDWRIGPHSRPLQLALVQGWFDAACEIAPHRAAAFSDWLKRRRAHIEAARSELRVGHTDLIARPGQP
jgi:hypothetical protein